MARRSLQSRVLEAVKAAGKMSIIEVRNILELSGSNGYARISNVMRDLMRAGYFERVARGTYAWRGEPKDLDYAQAQRRMVRIVRIRTKRREAFTVRKLAELSGCSVDWSRRYVAFLVKQKLLERTGFESVGVSQVKAPLYLAAESRLNEEWPAMHRKKRTSDIDAVAERIRKMAIKINRECQATTASLKVMTGYLRAMADIAEKVLAAADGLRKNDSQNDIQATN